MDRPLYFMVAALSSKMAGLEISVLRRAKLFIEKGGIIPTITNDSLSTDSLNIRKMLIDKEIFHPQLKFKNMYLDFQGITTSDLMDKFTGTLQHNITKQDNLSIDRITFSDGTLSLIKYVKDGRLYKIDLYHIQGYLAATFFFEHPTNRLSPTKTYLYDQEQPVVKKIFHNEAALKLEWLRRWFDGENGLFIVDRVNKYNYLFKSFPHYNLIAQFHSSHLMPHQNSQIGRFAYVYGIVLTQSPQIYQKIVVLTEQQKTDIQERLPYELPLETIGHFLLPVSTPFIYGRNRQDIVMLSRTDPDKNLEDAIKAFHKVTLYYDDVNLNIYGTNKNCNYYHQLVALVKELGLENRVFFHGFITNISEIFRSALCCINLSNREGFGLTYLESLQNGCPAFAYAIKYGPSEIIKSGETGFLAPEGNYELIGRAMVEFISIYKDCPAAYQVVEEACLKQAENYSEELILAKWQKLLAGLT
ncbi:glycosyltransferase [Vagococcus intermedius]|uniref:Glycosyltransferase n=1 Tax=Vagococcus intermedius TaxID=2991418 RepID=A0AAF0CT65_9ENTE|nr:glycosyltransferase [Vagococcus intermedius]WEG72490.1 glycosyltransferase [Vagococcus intermedius]WEG74577.1 glycosyltransferase [Vagococcus intermedius]